MALRHDLSVMLPLLLTAAVVQDLQPVLPRFGGKPNWLLAVVLYYSLARDRGLALLAALLAGLWMDALAGLPMGGSAVFFVWMAAAWARPRRALRGNGVVGVAAVGMLSAAVMGLYHYGLLRMSGYPALGISAMMLRTLAQAVTGAVMAPLVMVIAGRLDRALDNKPLRKEQDAFTWNRFS